MLKGSWCRRWGLSFNHLTIPACQACQTPLLDRCTVAAPFTSLGSLGSPGAATTGISSLCLSGPGLPTSSSGSLLTSLAWPFLQGQTPSSPFLSSSRCHSILPFFPGKTKTLYYSYRNGMWCIVDDRN
ncbi:hypothetical protein F5B20DRAFT_179274 [Whalleya microplaca]|nr:hypothetical protein F5B20DRAFT_179274 [Whalleya microplaca]